MPLMASGQIPAPALIPAIFFPSGTEIGPPWRAGGKKTGKVLSSCGH